ncbi:uncharacterized protein LOC122851023 [Aphidius gifuensis]|uniref:uncharacterized protein LOC122851023 n=1 Tax=Aphidius gifuensis TaxID=684658 RepID=UPI001CDB6296|nr:uncharacterized protein LOC122851023 [Aphidius gifuensis]
MGTNNQRLVNLLQVKVKNNNQQDSFTTVNIGSFIHDGIKYYVGYDVPHLFKRLLAFLRSRKPLTCDKKIIALYDDFILTFRVDRNTEGGSHLLSHIDERLHLRPNSFESMNVKRTFQMFGRRYAAAMKTAGHANLLISSKTWMETAGFIERCNDAIDALNTLTNKDEKRLNMKRVISDRNPQVENCLIDFLKWTLKWKLATGLLNQDNVEHLFSKFRQRGGNNANPTARGIRISTGHILSNGFTYKSAGCNTRKTEKESHKINNKNDSMSEEWNEEESDSEEDDDVGVLEDVDTLYGETKIKRKC